MQFHLRMNTDNAAFTGGDDDFGPGPEVARILALLAEQVDFVASPEHFLKLSGRLVDFNGNTCGRWAFGTGRWDVENGALGVDGSELQKAAQTVALLWARAEELGGVEWDTMGPALERLQEVAL